jgi:hypothetical protein
LLELEAHPVEAAQENGMIIRVLVRIEKASQRGLDDRRLVGAWTLGCRFESLGNLLGELDTDLSFHG